MDDSSLERGKKLAKSEVDYASDDKDTLISDKDQRPSYGTIDDKLKSKRYCFKMPDGKMVYGHHTSQPDSMMQVKEDANGGLFGNLGGGGNQLDNYFRAIDYIEQNIDFPPASEDDPVELYSYQSHIYLVLCTLMFLLNAGS